VGAEPDQRVVRLGPFDLFARPVGLVVVVGGGGGEGVRLPFNERGPPPRPAGKPYPPARAATSCTAICFDCGTLIAYWLFSHTKITGSRWMPLKFRPSCQSPSLVAPSPNQHPTTASSPRYRTAAATPPAGGAWGRL